MLRIRVEQTDPPAGWRARPAATRLPRRGARPARADERRAFVDVRMRGAFRRAMLQAPPTPRRQPARIAPSAPLPQTRASQMTGSTHECRSGPARTATVATKIPHFEQERIVAPAPSVGLPAVFDPRAPPRAAAAMTAASSRTKSVTTRSLGSSPFRPSPIVDETSGTRPTRTTSAPGCGPKAAAVKRRQMRASCARVRSGSGVSPTCAANCARSRT